MLPAAIRAIYPPSCMGCAEPALEDHALCGRCWRDTPFISGLVCDLCGVALPGEGASSDGLVCDDCMKIARPWNRGRSTLEYRDRARRFVLQLKHGDRTDLARPLAAWMARAAQPLLTGPALLVPVPLHRTRLFARRYNQAALLAKGMGESLDQPTGLDVLLRTVRTPLLGGLNRDERFRTLADIFAVSQKRRDQIEDRHILLVDDVMTTGATLAACTEALMAAGAQIVDVVTLARATKAD